AAAGAGDGERLLASRAALHERDLLARLRDVGVAKRAPVAVAGDVRGHLRLGPRGRLADLGDRRPAPLGPAAPLAPRPPWPPPRRPPAGPPSPWSCLRPP